MTTSRNAHEWTILAAMAALYIIWGSTYLGIRFAIETLPPFLMSGLRFLIAGAALYAWNRAQGVPRPTRIHWRSAFMVGGLMLLGGNGGVTWATQRVPSGLASLLIGAVPLWAVLLDWWFFDGARPNRRMTLGLVFGITGLVLLIGPIETAGTKNIDPLGAAALLVAGLAWAAGSLVSRRSALPNAPLMVTSIEMLSGGVLLTIAGTAAGEWSKINLAAVSLRSAVAVVYLTLIGSLVAFSVYIWLLKNTTTARATSYAYASPVIALFLGWALADESVTLRTILAAAIIIGSVILITSLRAQQPTPPEQSKSAPRSGTMPEAAEIAPASAGK